MIKQQQQQQQQIENDIVQSIQLAFSDVLFCIIFYTFSTIDLIN